MPAPARSLSVRDVYRYVRERCVEPVAERQVGVEVEWFAVRPDDPGAHVPFPLVERIAAAAPRPGGSLLTFEPGGQIELSSLPRSRIADAIGALRADADGLARALGGHGISLAGEGMDQRPHRRVLDLPRYRAMEAYFDVEGSAGRRMMRTTAAVQVNVGLGRAEDLERRWRLVGSIAPLLTAMFAHSPMLDGVPSGWRSTRMANWWAMDPSRTSPVAASGSLADRWAAYVLRANVMLIRCGDGDHRPMRERRPFARWIADGHELGYPDEEDLAYHLTTLFPPVRPRGWFEVRVIDALPQDLWPVAAAITVALLDDEEAADVAARACVETDGGWLAAFRHGLEHPGFARAARACVTAAIGVFGRLGVDERTTAEAEAFLERYVAPGRTPADDLLADVAVARSPVEAR